MAYLDREQKASFNRRTLHFPMFDSLWQHPVDSAGMYRFDFIKVSRTKKNIIRKSTQIFCSKQTQKGATITRLSFFTAERESGNVMFDSAYTLS